MLQNAESHYIKAGKVVASVLRLASSIVSDGMPVLELCEKLESEIVRRGALPAFPCNVSQGSLAAHYTPAPNDNGRIDCNRIVKIDVGAHVEGYIADAAISVTCNPSLQPIVETTKEALLLALSSLRAGMPLSDFGRMIESYANSRGYKVITNLAGHKLGHYELHTGVSVPNLGVRVPGRFEAGEAYALEPFLVPGYAAGRVVDGPPSNIFRLRSRRKVKDAELKKVVDHIWSNYRGLPFASRWVHETFGEKGMTALKTLLKLGIVSEYPSLIEASGAEVAQFEHTVLIRSSGEVIVTTRAG